MDISGFMGIKSVVSKPYAKWVSRKVIKDASHPFLCQEQILRGILYTARSTLFGKDFNFRELSTYEKYRNRTQLTDFEKMKPWVNRISLGEKDVLWPGLPIYFAKTSGTTSGIKYIPITRESIHNHIDTARNALLMYIFKTGRSTFTDHKMIFLQGSPALDSNGVIPTGRLSGIAAHYIPGYLQKNRLPSWQTNCIDDWETKVDTIVRETINQPMSLISGIPSWLRMYFEKLVEASGKPIGELFPDFSLLVHGGVNFEPYRAVFNNLIAREVDTLQLFPASEGFFAFQDRFPADDMLLNVNSGIFYEFIPVDLLNNPDQSRIPLEEVKMNIDYALIITSNAGLYAYSIGDTVRFTSTSPFRIKISGRTAHYISAFGEHVIVSEVESAMAEVLRSSDTRIAEFTVAPLINPEIGKPRHEWYIEFDKVPDSMEHFATELDNALCRKNIYYNDLITGHVLDKLIIKQVPKGGFNEYMKSKGMLGGQNKLPRLSDNRVIADGLSLQN